MFIAIREDAYNQHHLNLTSGNQVLVVADPQCGRFQPPISRNEFESGVGAHMWCEAPEKNLSCRPFFLSPQVQLVVLVSAFVMISIQFGQFLVCCLFGVPRAHPFVKFGSRAPVPHGVGATDAEISFPPDSKKHDWTQ